MRRREIQSFTLKLSDLKEYDTVRSERLNENRSHPNKNDNISMSQDNQMKLVPRWGPKTKQEISERIGISS